MELNPRQHTFILNPRNLKVVGIVVGILLTFLIFMGYCAGDDEKQQTVSTTTTTTTLPPKDAQACEYLTAQALLAGGIIADVDPKTTDDRKRCTFEDIGGEVNYITLYVDVVSQCDTLFANALDKEALPEVSPGAIYSEEMDPTVIVSQGTRCFFVQGAKTIVTKESLTNIAKEVTNLFAAVDSSTTTTTQATVILPETSLSPIPGQNTAATTTTIPST